MRSRRRRRRRREAAPAASSSSTPGSPTGPCRSWPPAPRGSITSRRDNEKTERLDWFDSLHPATTSLSRVSNSESNSESAGLHFGVRLPWSWSFFDCGFQPFLGDLLDQLFHRDLLRVERDSQQIGVPLVIHRLNAWKPYQGFFDPVGSVFSQELQPLAHVFDIEPDCRRAPSREAAGRVRPATAEEEQGGKSRPTNQSHPQPRRKDDPIPASYRGSWHRFTSRLWGYGLFVSTLTSQTTRNPISQYLLRCIARMR